VLARVAIVAAMLSLSSLGGCCSHATMRGAVVMKIDDHDAHVCLGTGEVVVSDAVNIVRHVCLPAKSGVGKDPQSCEPRIIGHAVVVQVLNDHYSLVRITQGEFQEGDIVEKAK